MSPKLFVFVATDAPVAVVIRKGKFNGRPCYEMIRWNLATNEFTEGQWLMNKQLFVRGCAISPNGQWFGWVYNKYWVWPRNPSDKNTVAGVSCIPYFTAELFATKTCGRWYSVQFDRRSRPLPSTFAFEQRGDGRLVVSDSPDPVPSGLQDETFVWNGKTVTVNGYQLLVDGNVVYDATDHVFVNRPSPTTVAVAASADTNANANVETPPPLRRSNRIRRPIVRYGSV